METVVPTAEDVGVKAEKVPVAQGSQTRSAIAVAAVLKYVPGGHSVDTSVVQPVARLPVVDDEALENLFVPRHVEHVLSTEAVPTAE